jgi:hypothetical protein
MSAGWRRWSGRFPSGRSGSAQHRIRPIVGRHDEEHARRGFRRRKVALDAVHLDRCRGFGRVLDILPVLRSRRVQRRRTVGLGRLDGSPRSGSGGWPFRRPPLAVSIRIGVLRRDRNSTGRRSCLARFGGYLVGVLRNGSLRSCSGVVRARGPALCQGRFRTTSSRDDADMVRWLAADEECGKRAARSGRQPSASLLPARFPLPGCGADSSPASPGPATGRPGYPRHLQGASPTGPAGPPARRHAR